MAFDIVEQSIESIQHALFSGRTTVREVVLGHVARIEALNSSVNAVLSLNPYALDEADNLDRSLAAATTSQRSLLLRTKSMWGIPVLVKDNINTRNMPTTGGCAALANHRPAKNAGVVELLISAGAVILGKTNLHELALEGLTVSSLGGQTLNPYDRTRTPGGSSGGSAAAVAASFCVVALGTDTVNSLRSPASANSLFSIRPTRGRVSPDGCMRVTETQDAIGPMGRNARDVAIALAAMLDGLGASSDTYLRMDPKDERRMGNFEGGFVHDGLAGKTFGFVEGFMERSTRSEVTPVNEAMQEMLQNLKSHGVKVVSIRDDVYDANALLKMNTIYAEFGRVMDQYLSTVCDSSEHGHELPQSLTELYATGQYLVIPDQYELVKRALRIQRDLGLPSRGMEELHLSDDEREYKELMAAIKKLKLVVKQSFASHGLDALVYPQQKNLVVTVGSPSQSGRNGILAALTGFPAIAIPVGFAPGSSGPPGIPIGMELLGLPFSDGELLQIACEIERRIPIRKPPPMAATQVDVRDFMPQIAPTRSFIASAYPIGQMRG